MKVGIEVVLVMIEFGEPASNVVVHQRLIIHRKCRGEGLLYCTILAGR
jgi:hypothetical protein